MKIACLIPAGLGGTQKAGWLFADGLARLGHEVVGYSGMGPFVPESPQPGLTVEIIANECDSFPAIADGRFDAIHVHMPGYYIRHPIYPFLKSLGKKRPRVVETNVFGWLQDWRANSVTDYRLFISMTSAWQAAKRSGKPLHALTNCSVARYPVFPAPVFSTEERQKVRHELGFGDDDIVALRFGRPDAAKWTDWECAATMRVRRCKMPSDVAGPSYSDILKNVGITADENGGGSKLGVEGPNVAWRAGIKDQGAGRQGGKNLKLLAMEPPAELKQRIISGEFGDGIVVREVESSPTRIAAIVDASDIILHAARFGESFGYAVAEGMAAGKPVITRTTPWGDNAQVELVEHGATGFVCCSEEGLAAALHLLVGDQELRTSMSRAGRERIHRLAMPERECQIVAAALTGDEVALRDRWSEILEFSRTISEREWDVIEKSDQHLLARAPEILHRELAHARSMAFKKKLSGLRANARALLGRTSYH